MKPHIPESWQLTLIPLSPVHIGCGETVEPYEYDVVAGRQVTQFLVFDVNRLLMDLTPDQRKEFYHVVDRCDFPRLRQWLRNHADREKHRRFAMGVHPDAADELLRQLDDPRRRGEIHLFQRHPVTHRIFIPGSSVKGAIRTAILDGLAQASPNRSRLERISRNGRGNHRAGVSFEAATLGNEDSRGSFDDPRADLYRDPFRQLAISDLAGPSDATYVDRIRIRRRGGDFAADPSGIVIYREVTRSEILEKEFPFVGDLRLSPHLADRSLMGRDRDHRENALPFALSLPELIQRCMAFYKPRFEEEFQQWFSTTGRLAERLRAVTGHFDENECLIRLGRHSHFECVTVGEPFHCPPSRGSGGSRSLAGKLPLGWAKLRFSASPAP